MSLDTETFKKRYVTFERATALALLFGMAIVTILAIWNFLLTVFGVMPQVAEAQEYTVFQKLFDRILAALIALELMHSIYQMAIGRHGLTQVKTVIVIGVLAVVRKLIILEVETTSGVFLIGLAAAILALGALFALVHWVESAREGEVEAATPGART